jgi:predicted trehalose synthase
LTAWSADALGDWIAGQRWFAGKSRRIVTVVLEDGVRLGGGTLWIAGVTLDDGRNDRYALPLLDGPTLADALDDPGFCRALLDVIARAGRRPGAQGEIVGVPTRAVLPTVAPDGPARRLDGEQSNTSVIFGDALILKHFRRLAVGANPDVEITGFLTERTSFRHTPRLAGSLEYRDAAGSWALAMVQELVGDSRDGWRWLLSRLAAGDAALGALGTLGRRTAELHLALASDPREPAFAPERITPADVAAWTEAVQQQLDAARAARAAFAAAYREAAGAAPFVPATEPALTRALAVLEVEKAAYEIVYEANNRPDWVAIPVRGLLTATAALRSGRAAGAA